MTDLRQQRLSDYLDHMIQAVEQVDVYLTDVTEAQFLSTPLHEKSRYSWLRKHRLRARVASCEKRLVGLAFTINANQSRTVKPSVVVFSPPGGPPPAAG